MSVNFFSYSFLDKRNSTGNLYFTDSLQDSILSNNLGKAAQGSHHGSQPVGQRTGNSSCTGSITSIESTATIGSSTTDMAMSVSKELRTAAGTYVFVLPSPMSEMKLKAV